MKKFLSFIFVLAAVLSLTYNSVADQEIKVNVDGQNISFPDAKPFVDENSRTLVPVRFIAEKLGANVSWDEKTQTIFITKSDDTVILRIGDDKVTINGVATLVDTRTVLKDDRTFVPLRLSANALRAEVTYDSDSNTANISTTSILAQVAQIPEMSYFTGNKLSTTSNYFLQLPGNGVPILGIKYTNPVSAVTMLSITDYSESTLNVVKKIFQIYFPTSYETVFNTFKDTIDTGNVHDNMTFDGRKIRTMRFTYGKGLYN